MSRTSVVWALVWKMICKSFLTNVFAILFFYCAAPTGLIVIEIFVVHRGSAALHPCLYPGRPYGASLACALVVPYGALLLCLAVVE